VLLVLDVVHEDLQAVDLGGKRGGDRRKLGIVGFRDDAGGARRVGLRDRLEAELAQRVAALAERLGVRQAASRSAASARQRHQLMAHAQEMLADDESPPRAAGGGCRPPPRHRVLDGIMA
jgi:hypothetical protein